MPHSYFGNTTDTVFVDGIDFKRAARQYRKFRSGPDGSPIPFEQALEELAEIVGSGSYHEIRAQARHVLADEDRQLQPYEILAKEALAYGAPFPKELPERFGKTWQERAVAIFRQALAKRDPSRKEIVALVGSEGSGKTMLARYMAKIQGGAVLDATITSFDIPASDRKPGAVLVYDRPARLPDEPKGFPIRRDGSVDMDLIRRQVRSRFDPFDMQGLYTRLLDAVQNENGSHFVVSLPTEGDALNLLTSTIRPGFRDRPASFIWQSVHLVNLDTMEFSTMVPPPIEEWAKQRAAANKALPPAN